MAKKAAGKSSGGQVEIAISAVEQARIRVPIVSESPLICERMSEKAKTELLLPGGTLTTADKAARLKHTPLAEYRASGYRVRDPESPTALAALAAWFKKSMMRAAIDTPGAKMAQIGRLVRVEGERIPLYGVPKLLMSVVRSSDMARTPDIRSRAILPKWAVFVDITFEKSLLKEKSLLNLLARAGRFSGVGGWRTEKGSGNYGSFRLANTDDPELLEIIASGGSAAQEAALGNPDFYDDDTESLFVWYNAELERRGIAIPS